MKRDVVKRSVFPLALAAGLTLVPTVVRGQDATRPDAPKDEVRPSELIDKAKKNFDEARTLDEQSRKQKEEAARLEREAQAKRDEARGLQKNVLQHDFVTAQDRLRALTLRRDAEDKTVFSSLAEKRARDLDDRSRALTSCSRDHLRLAKEKRDRARDVRDPQMRTRLEQEAKVNEEVARSEQKIASEYRNESQEAEKRAARFRDQAMAQKRDADRIDPSGTTSEPTELKAGMRHDRTDSVPEGKSDMTPRSGDTTPRSSDDLRKSGDETPNR